MRMGLEGNRVGYDSISYPIPFQACPILGNGRADRARMGLERGYDSTACPILFPSEPVESSG